MKVKLNIPEYVSRKQLSEVLKVSPISIKRWEEKGELVPVLFAGRKKFYKREDVEKYLENYN